MVEISTGEMQRELDRISELVQRIKLSWRNLLGINAIKKEQTESFWTADKRPDVPTLARSELGELKSCMLTYVRMVTSEKTPSQNASNIEEALRNFMVVIDLANDPSEVNDPEELFMRRLQELDALDRATINQMKSHFEVIRRDASSSSAIADYSD